MGFLVLLVALAVTVGIKTQEHRSTRWLALGAILALYALTSLATAVTSPDASLSGLIGSAICGTATALCIRSGLRRRLAERPPATGSARTPPGATPPAPPLPPSSVGRTAPTVGDRWTIDDLFPQLPPDE